MAVEESIANAAGNTRTWLGWDDLIETIAVLVLATASLAAAWSGYQAAEWGTVQSTLYSQASSHRMQSTQASTAAHLDTIVDLEAFNNFANAYATDNIELMEFHRGQFSDRLAPAVEAWLATDPLNNPDAANTPLSTPEYVVPESARAAELESEAEDLFARGVRASEQSGSYVLNTVYLATALFFAGIVTKVRGRPARSLIIGLGIMLLVFGLYHVVTLPIG